MPYIEFSNPVSVKTSPTLPKATPFSMKSIFSDNAKVCYKTNCMSYGGIGTVRNGRAKIRKT